MSNVLSIFKRELRVYFTSPIAYAVMFIFLVVSGYFFYSSLSYYAVISFQAARNPYMQGLNIVDMVLTPMFGNISVIMLLMLPLLTMRLFAEEKKSGTYELLFSYPIRDIEVVLGKYLAALFVVVLMLVLTGLYHLILWGLGVPEPGVTLSGFIGLFLQAAAFIALGVMVSSMTENQIVSGVATFGALLMFWVAGWSAGNTREGLAGLLNYLSLVNHLVNFTKGVVDTADVSYYLCFIFVFLFLTLRSLESKRWRG